MSKPLDTVFFGLLGAGSGLVASAGRCTGSCAACLQCYAAGGVAAVLVIAARLRGGRRANKGQRRTSMQIDECPPAP